LTASPDAVHVRCPGCGQAQARDRGAIPPASEFAGRLLQTAVPGGRLYECRACGLHWRWPLQAPGFYADLYASAGAGAWHGTGERTDHRLLRERLQRHLSRGAVLDIGCGDGTLLASLPPQYGRFGIEIGQDARLSAAARGVEIIGSDFIDLDHGDLQFDAIVACDVIEHTTDPRVFVASAVRRLRPGGLLMLTTGDASAWLWRLCAGRFWYCQFAEHLTFITPRWLEGLEAVRVVETERFAYGRLSFARKVKLTVLLGLYLLAPAAFGRWLAHRRGLASSGLALHANPPGQGLTRDHLLAVLRRSDAVDASRP
jgi:SAM-dependent methyltransferase